MSACYTSYKKQDLIDTAHYLLKQTCCDAKSCSDLAEDLEDLQYKCNDMFGKMHDGEIDERGNIPGTLCSRLQIRKNAALDTYQKLRTRGGKKIKIKTKRFRKSRKNIKKSTKYRRSKK